MKAIIVLSFDLEPDDLATVLEEIDPPHLPGFTGTARISVDPVATQIERWLDDDA